MTELKIALKQPQNLKLEPPFIILEGPESWNISRHEEFATKLRLYLDDLEHYKFLSHIRFIDDPNLTSLENERFNLFKKITKDVQTNIQRSLGSPGDSLLGIQNLFKNLDLVIERPDISHLKAQKPFRALVLAAGPSLTLALPILKQIQSKCLLVCVDASFKTLIENGIQPHIVVAIERDDYSVRFFQNLSDKNLSTLLLAHATVKRELFDSYQGRKATALKFTGPFMWLPFQRSRFWTASSSAHLAYRVCTELGASEVALVGQDLSFHPDTFQSHCPNPDFPEWAEASTADARMNEKEAFFVKGNTREKVLSDPIWGQFAHEYQVLVSQAQVKTVNTSELGMAIPGIPYVPLQEWIKGLDGLPFSLEVPTESPSRVSDEKALRTKIQAAVQNLQAIQKEISGAQNQDEISTLYSEIIRRDHFLELVFEVIFSLWVITENEILNVSDQKRMELQKDFLNRCHTAIDHVLGIIKASPYSR